jgi:hypothetical protein
MDIEDGEYPSGVWINAIRFRQRYLETMHFTQAAARARWIDKLSHCTALLFDEIDKLKASEGLAEILYGILDERLSDDRLTILTTNSTGPELQAKWGEEYGPYLVRRLRDFCRSIDCDP